MLWGMSFNYCDVTGSVIDYSESSGGNKVACEKMKTNPCFCSFFDRKSCTIRIFLLIFRVLKFAKKIKKSVQIMNQTPGIYGIDQPCRLRSSL